MVVDKVKFDEYYEALINRNSQYLGSFYVGVKTTRIFCIATCRARKPKRENVVFYKTSDEALAQGFRACKVCKPLEKVEAVPKDIQQLIDQVNEYPDRKITDEGLKTMGLRPEKVRRWFKKNLKTKNAWTRFKFLFKRGKSSMIFTHGNFYPDSFRCKRK